MKRMLTIFVTLLGCLSSTAFAGESALLTFSTDEGLSRLSRAAARQDFGGLANQFEAQYNNVFCGPASATVVLNALYSGRRSLPRDRSRLRESDLRHLPPTADISLPRFTQ